MNLIKLWDINKQEIRLQDYGLIGLRLLPHSPSYERTDESVLGRPGVISMGKDLNARNITVVFITEGYDYSDSVLVRDEIYKIFSEKLYIGEIKQPGKYWLVESLNEWEPDRLNVFSNRIEIILTAEKGLAESIGRTTDSFEWDADLWQWGMGIPYDEYKYEHTTNEFVVYNAGTEVINPRFMELKIEIQAITSSYLELINHTTGDIYRYDGELTSGDTLIIDGIRSTKNGLSVFRNTNRKLINLASGENNIEVKGAQLERILFDFKFYYI